MHARSFALPCSAIAGAMAILIAVLAVTFPDDVQAATYKCVDENGHTTFTQSRCPTPGGHVESIASTSRRGASVDCGIARNFASQAASAMKQGQPSSAVFGRHGGIDSLSPAAISIVSYVYEFKSNDRASASRVTELAVNRCQAGSYGDVGCNAFPSRFIAELGGCEGANTFGGSYGSRSFQDPAAAQDAYEGAATSDGAAPTRQRNRSVDSANADREQCRMRVALQIAEANAEMRASRSTRGHEQLNARRRSLGKQLNAC